MIDGLLFLTNILPSLKNICEFDPLVLAFQFDINKIHCDSNLLVVNGDVMDCLNMPDPQLMVFKNDHYRSIFVGVKV